MNIKEYITRIAERALLQNDNNNFKRAYDHEMETAYNIAKSVIRQKTITTFNIFDRDDLSVDYIDLKDLRNDRWKDVQGEYDQSDYEDGWVSIDYENNSMDVSDRSNYIFVGEQLRVGARIARAIEGNFEASIKITSISEPTQASISGFFLSNEYLMSKYMNNPTTDPARKLAFYIDESDNIGARYSNVGGATLTTQWHTEESISLPIWLKIKREDQTITIYSSTDGVTYTQEESTTFGNFGDVMYLHIGTMADEIVANPTLASFEDLLIVEENTPYNIKFQSENIRTVKAIMIDDEFVKKVSYDYEIEKRKKDELGWYQKGDKIYFTKTLDSEYENKEIKIYAISDPKMPFSNTDNESKNIFNLYAVNEGQYELYKKDYSITMLNLINSDRDINFLPYDMKIITDIYRYEKKKLEEQLKKKNNKNIILDT